MDVLSVSIFIKSLCLASVHFKNFRWSSFSCSYCFAAHLESHSACTKRLKSCWASQEPEINLILNLSLACMSRWTFCPSLAVA